MSRSGRGDRHAFEILVRRHQRSVLNFIYRFIGDRIEAEDQAQEVFLRAWQSAATYKPTAKFTTWIYRIAANLCINKLDKLVKSQKTSFSVIPAKAGIQCFQRVMTDLDPGFRRGDDFLRSHQG